MKKLIPLAFLVLITTSIVFAQSSRIVGLQFDFSNASNGSLTPVFVDRVTGEMTKLNENPASAAEFSSGNSTLDPINYKYYYIRGLNNNLVSVDLATGAVSSANLNNPNNADIPIISIQYNPADGKIYGLNMTGNTLRFAKIDPSTSQVSLVNTNPVSAASFSSGDAALDPFTGTYYYVRGDQTKELIKVNIQTGISTSTPILNPNEAISPIANIQWNPVDSMLYGLNFTSGQLRLAKLNPSTGFVTIISPSAISADAFSSGVAALDVNLQRYLYVRGNPQANQLVEVDLATGQVINNPSVSVEEGTRNLTNIEYLPITNPISRFRAKASCGDVEVDFKDLSLSDNVLWDFGDGNTSSNTNPTHIYASTGTYTVTQTAISALGTSLSSQTVTVSPQLIVDLGPDKALLPNDTITLDATTAGATEYLWNTGATSPTLRVTQSGIYWCRIKNAANCVGRDTVEVSSIVPFSIDDSSNTTITNNAANELEAIIWIQNHEASASIYAYETNVNLPSGWQLQEACSNGITQLDDNRIKINPNAFGGFHFIFNTAGGEGTAEGIFTLKDAESNENLHTAAFSVSTKTASLADVSTQKQFAIYPNPAKAGTIIQIGNMPKSYEVQGINGQIIDKGIATEVTAPNQAGVYFLKTPSKTHKVVVIN